MFPSFFIQLVSVLFLVQGIFASPLWNKRSTEPSRSVNSSPSRNESISFNNWGGFSSLDNFDSFNGRDNFDGSRNTQIVVVQEQQVVCRQQRVEIIQQQLVILQEMAKRILTEQVCEVETQTIIFTQFHAGLQNFRSDLQRQGGRVPGFDRNVASQVQHLLNSDGSLNDIDFEFTGGDVGRNTVVPSGSNWRDDTSPESVRQALEAANAAKNTTSTRD